jgi:hypothetical protein
MPPRWLSLAIVAFWLATTGFLLYRDVWPLLLPGQAPPYTIDLEDEVQTQQAHIHWNVSYNDHDYLRAETWVEPNPDDTFTLKARLKPQVVVAPKDHEGGAEPFGGLVKIQKSTSSYRVTRSGDLRAVSVDFAVEANAAGLTLAGDGELSGEVRDGKFYSRLRVHHPGGTFEKDLEPVAVSRHGSVLSPLHPLNRIDGLRPGQTWRLPLVDPIKDALLALATGQAGEEKSVEARVLPETQTLTWNNHPVACLVIEYQGEDVTARTWVRADNGLVLRQEAKRDGERWVLQRE